MVKTKNLEKIEELLTKHFRDNIGVDEVISKWPNLEHTMTKQEATLFHQLFHYQADQDIFIKDKAYETHARAELIALFEDLV